LAKVIRWLSGDFMYH